MPQHKSNEKRMRTGATARTRNILDKSHARVAEKRVLQSKDFKEATGLLVEAYKVLDSMTSKGVLHQNTAARQKSKLASYVSSLQSAA
jgi:small subunit ribosomal protein S20